MNQTFSIFKTVTDYEFRPFLGDLYITEEFNPYLLNHFPSLDCKYEDQCGNDIITIMFISANTKSVPIKASIFDTCEEIVQRNWKKLELCGQELRFIYKGRQLEQKHSLINYNICNDSVIYLLLCLRGGGNPYRKLSKLNKNIKIVQENTKQKFLTMKVIVAHEYGKINCLLTKNCTVLQLKVLLVEKLELQWQKCNFFYQQIELQNGIILRYLYNIIQQKYNFNTLEINMIYGDIKLKLITNQQIKINYYDGDLKCETFKFDKSYTMINLNNKQCLKNEGIIRKYCRSNHDILGLTEKDGANQIKFYCQLNKIYMKGIRKLQKCLNFLDQQKLNQFITLQNEQIHNDNNKRKFLQRFDLQEILAIQLYTSSLVYRQFNQDLRQHKYQQWEQYLSILIVALRKCPYHDGILYRGIKNYKDCQMYRYGKLLQWNEIQSFSKQEQVAEEFSNQNGTLFILHPKIGFDISKLSILEGEEEVIMLPYSKYEIIKVENQQNQFVVEMKELPTPKYFKIILWVDDCQKDNFEIMSQCQYHNKDIQFMLCNSTSEAIKTLQTYKWLTFLEQTEFKIITDMCRIENNQMNYYAGAEFIKTLQQEFHYNNEILIFARDKVKAKENCNKLKLEPYYIIATSVNEVINFILE